MPINVSALKSKRGKITLFRGDPDGELNVIFRIHTQDVDSVANIVAASEDMSDEEVVRANVLTMVGNDLIDWDLEDNGAPIPLDNPEAVLKLVPLSVFILIAYQIGQERDPNQKAAKRK